MWSVRSVECEECDVGYVVCECEGKGDVCV